MQPIANTREQIKLITKVAIIRGFRFRSRLLYSGLPFTIYSSYHCSLGIVVASNISMPLLFLYISPGSSRERGRMKEVEPT